MKPKRVALIVVLAVSVAGSVTGSPGPYPRKSFPVRDEAAKDPSLTAFRANLRGVVARRDISSLSELMDEGIRVELLPLISASGEPDLWRELERALSLGGSFTTKRGAKVGREEYCAPYAYSGYPGSESLSDELLALTEGEVWIVIGNDVPVRSRPSSTAPVIAKLSSEVVAVQEQDRRDASGGKKTFQFVELPSGRTGYVDGKSLWGPSKNYHACFTKHNNSWRMTVFQTGMP